MPPEEVVRAFGFRAISSDLVDSRLSGILRAYGGQKMAEAFSYACRDCEGMEACPASVIAETKDEVWKLMKLHAQVAHDENPADWDKETVEYLDTLIKPVSV